MVVPHSWHGLPNRKCPFSFGVQRVTSVPMPFTHDSGVSAAVNTVSKSAADLFLFSSSLECPCNTWLPVWSPQAHLSFVIRRVFFRVSLTCVSLVEFLDRTTDGTPTFTSILSWPSLASVGQAPEGKGVFSECSPISVWFHPDLRGSFAAVRLVHPFYASTGDHIGTNLSGSIPMGPLSR